MTEFPGIATCAICHSGSIYLFMNKEIGPILQCDDCGYTRRAETKELDQDFLISA